MRGITGGADIGVTLGAIRQGEGATPIATPLGRGEGRLGEVTHSATLLGQGVVLGEAIHWRQEKGRGGVARAVYLEASRGV